jgi:Ser/Thr protein kinase RdoA (MazF antagonist)
MLDEQVSDLARRLGIAADRTATTVERFGDTDAWLVRDGDHALVLKRGRSEQDDADIAWEHAVLRGLAAAGFPSSVPVAAFDGRSWTHLDGRIWGALSFLPGRPLASEAAPDSEAAGAFLARYHQAARTLAVEEQRPTAAPITRLREVTRWDHLQAALGSSEALVQFDRLLDDLDDGLRELEYEQVEQIVIHGDATHENLIVDGSPPRIVGLIDFGSAHLAGWPLDLAAALWRSGRAVDSNVELDLGRVGQYVRGYHREIALTSELAGAIPLLIQGRGLQLISRRVRRLPPDWQLATLPYLDLTLRRTIWVNAHRDSLVDAVGAALR